MHRILSVGAALLCAGTAYAGTLEEVQSRGQLNCGVNTSLIGFASQDSTGTWGGFDVGICRAVAAAVLGDPTAVSFVQTTEASGYDALTSGRVDLLVRNTTWSFSSDVNQKVSFAGVTYFDGQGFLVPKALGISSARELEGRGICVQSNTTSAQNLEEFFTRYGMSYETLSVEGVENAQALYLAGECQVYSSEVSHLAAIRATFANPGEHVLLEDIISKEPLGPVVRQGDDLWTDIVRWVLYALIGAEELEVTSANVLELKENGASTPEVARLLGREGQMGESLGLDSDWAVRAIKAGGNYGELFARNIGETTPVGLSRGLNLQWSDGGLLYSPPFR